MRAHRTTRPALLVLSISILSGCDAADRVRARFVTTDTVSVTSGSGLALSMQAPGLLRPGSEGVLRLSLTNQTDSVVSQARLELIVPGWAEPMPPRIGEREVSMAALEDGSTRFAYRMEETPLNPAETQTVEQRIRVPITPVAPSGSIPWTRTVRARLLGPDGQPLAQVESEIALDSVAAAGFGASGMPGDSMAVRDRLGSYRIGMTTAELRRGAASARDTTWSQEGMAQRGIVVPAEGGGNAVAVLSGDTVTRLQVTDPRVRTPEQLGVGSTFGELRSAYGAPCVETAEGRVVVWFANAPGLSFALDQPVPGNPAQLRQNPESLPQTARVTSWWVHGGRVPCATQGTTGMGETPPRPGTTAQ